MLQGELLQVGAATVDDRGDEFNQRPRQAVGHLDAGTEVDDGEHAVVADEEVPGVRVGVHAADQVGG